MGQGVNLALTTRSSNGLDLASRESGLRGPRLVVERVVNQVVDRGLPTQPTPPPADPAPRRIRPPTPPSTSW